MSGQALTVTSGTGQDPAGLGLLGPSAASPRPNLVSNPSVNNPTIDRWFDPSAFAEPASGTVGNAGRGILRGPNLYRWDLSAFKNIKATEHIRFQLRAELFKAFNQVNWGTPGTSWPGAANIANNAFFGRITSARQPRNIQLGLKMYF